MHVPFILHQFKTQPRILSIFTIQFSLINGSEHRHSLLRFRRRVAPEDRRGGGTESEAEERGAGEGAEGEPGEGGEDEGGAGADDGAAEGGGGGGGATLLAARRPRGGGGESGPGV